MKVVINTYGNNLIGMGHIFRQLALADELKRRKAEILFLMRNFPEGVNKVISNGWAVETIPAKYGPTKEAKFCLVSFKKFKPDIVVVDHLNTSRIKMKSFSKTGTLLVTFDDWGEGKWYADISIDALYQKAIPRPKFSKTKIFSGIRYIILRKEFNPKNLEPKKIKKKGENILIVQGGSDTWGVTPKIVRALSGINQKIKTTVVIGAAFKHNKQLKKAITESRGFFEVKRDVKNLVSLMRKADIAISAAGITLFELLAVGVPTIVITSEPKELETAFRLEKENLIINLGLWGGKTGGGISSEMVKLAVENTIKDFRLRKLLSRKGQNLLLGLGTKRVAGIIFRECKKRKK